MITHRTGEDTHIEFEDAPLNPTETELVIQDRDGLTVGGVGTVSLTSAGTPLVTFADDALLPAGNYTYQLKGLYDGKWDIIDGGLLRVTSLTESSDEIIFAAVVIDGGAPDTIFGDE